MRGNHKGDLNLSVSAVVILILAVTMLGLGLAFIKNIFGGAIEDLNTVRGNIRDNVIKDLRISNQRLGFNEEDIRVNRADKKDIYYGVKNELESPWEFGVGVECLQSSAATPIGLSCTESSCPAIQFEYFTQTPLIKDGEIGVMKVILSADPGADRSTYLCVVKVCEELDDDCLTNTDPYAQKNFFITVE